MKSAIAALSADGYDAAQWVVEEIDRRPDGKADAYLHRYDPRSGALYFHRKDDPRERRLVHMEVEGDTIRCKIIWPK